MPRNFTLPPHTEPRLPIHPNIAPDLRSFHTKYPPPTLTLLLEQSVKLLREASADLAEKRREFVLERDTSDGNTSVPRNADTEVRIAKLGNKVEKNVRGLLDVSEGMKLLKRSIGEISEKEKNRGEGSGGQPVADFKKKMREGKGGYKRRDLKDRYDVAEYIDYRKMVHVATLPNAPLPSKREMFKTPIFITDAEVEMEDDESSAAEEEEEERKPKLQDSDLEDADSSPPPQRSKTASRRSQKQPSRRRQPSVDLDSPGPQEEALAANEESSDEEIAVTSEQKSLKCPLTMKLFVTPVTTLCGHTYEQDALVDLLKTHKRMKKPPMCPTPGCEKVLKSEKDWKVDEVMMRRVEMQRRREEREAEQDAMDEDEDGDEEEEEQPKQRSKSLAKSVAKNKSVSRASVMKMEQEIPSGNEGGGEEEVPSNGEGRDDEILSSGEEGEEEDQDDEGDEESEEEEDGDESFQS